MSVEPPLPDPGAPATIAARIGRWATHGLQGPMTLEVYPTLSCNLDCVFCDTTDRHRPPVDELSTARWLELLDEAAALGVQRVFVLGGGEPLARRDCATLLARVKTLGLEGILTTNGTLLTPAIAHQLVHTGWDEVHVSIDGPTAAIHDRLRGRPGAFRRTVRNTCRLGRLARLSGAPLRLALHFVVTSDNWHTLPAVVRLARSLGAHRVDFDALIAYTPAQKALQLPEAARAALPEVARAALAVADQLGIATTLHHFLDPSVRPRGETDVAGTPAPGIYGAPCLKAWHYLVVQADGRTSPCCVLAGEGGSVRTRSLQAVWAGDPFLGTVRRGMLDKQPLPRCRECSANILGHEAAIRSALPPAGPSADETTPWT